LKPLTTERNPFFVEIMNLEYSSDKCDTDDYFIRGFCWWMKKIKKVQMKVSQKKSEKNMLQNYFHWKQNWDLTNYVKFNAKIIIQEWYFRYLGENVISRNNCHKVESLFFTKVRVILSMKYSKYTLMVF